MNEVGCALKTATFRLGFSRQPKEAWSLNPMGANLISIGSFKTAQTSYNNIYPFQFSKHVCF